MKNKKGFTLIELLAVIVILALLVAVAIPAVTKYLNTSRKGVFADNAAAAISAVRNDVIINGISDSTKNYSIEDVNKLLEKKLQNSPWGAEYFGTVTVTYDDKTKESTYSIFLSDGTHCIVGDTARSVVAENSVNDEKVVTDTTKCAKPS